MIRFMIAFAIAKGHSHCPLSIPSSLFFSLCALCSWSNSRRVDGIKIMPECGRAKAEQRQSNVSKLWHKALLTSSRRRWRRLVVCEGVGVAVVSCLSMAPRQCLLSRCLLLALCLVSCFLCAALSCLFIYTITS